MSSRSVDPRAGAQRAARQRVSRRNRRRTPLPDLVRKVLALALGLTAALLLVTAESPADADQTAIVVAARDLPAGATLTVDDLTTRDVPAGDEPAHAVQGIESAVGRQTSGAVRRGEPLTDARLVGPPAYSVPAGRTPLVVTVTDATSLVTVAEGDCVDLYAGYAGAPLDKVASGGLLVSVLPGASTQATAPEAGDTNHAVSIVVGITNEQITTVVSALAADVLIATVCHAWPTSVGQEPA